MIINYPGNPDGLTYNKVELKDLARVAKELNLLLLTSLQQDLS